MRRLMRAIVNGLRLRRRLLVAAAVAVVTLIALPSSIDVAVRASLGWCAGGFAYLILAFALMSRCDTHHIQRTARIEDEARFVFVGLILLAILSSFVAVFALIGDAKTLSGIPKALVTTLAAVTVLVSWLVTQVIFTLHYAHDYYGADDHDGPHRRGLIFPNDDAPDYWDFFYFTTSIGATSQTSDVAITSKALRRVATFQSVLAFVFNTTVVALAINLASGLI